MVRPDLRSTGRPAMVIRMNPFVITAVIVASASFSWARTAVASVRQPVLAGSWYPKDRSELAKDVAGYLGDAAAPAHGSAPLAIIVPHAGYIYSGAIAGKGFATLRGRAYDRVILIGPSHRVPFDGAALPNDRDEAWRTPLGDVPLDQAALVALASSSGFTRLPKALEREHSLEIELPFLQVALAPGFRLAPILIGTLDGKKLEEVSSAIRPLLRRGTLVVISSDFTHYGPNYGYVPYTDSVSTRISRMDMEAVDAIERISVDDFEKFRQRTSSTICGAEPIRILLTMLRGSHPRVERMGYAQSGSLMGDFTNSVSYVSMAFWPAGDGSGMSGSSPGPSDRIEPGSSPGSMGAGAPRPLSLKEQEFLLSLARQTIAARLHGRPLPEARAPEEFGTDSPVRQVQGVFVTLTERGRLRGCIGSITGTEPLVEGVSHQALHSAFEDPRFPPMTPRELDGVHIEISVLTPPVEVRGPEEIVVGRHGVFIEKHGYRAVFLPQVATEQGWDRETLLRQLCRKAGLKPDDWKSGATFEVFEAQIFEEKEQNGG